MISKSEEVGLKEMCIRGIFKYGNLPFKEYHSHQGFAEIVIIFEGKVNHMINGEMLTVEGPSLIFLRERDVHGFSRHAGKGCTMMLLMFTLEVFKKVCSYLFDEEEPELFNDLNKPIVLSLTADEDNRLYDYIIKGTRDLGIIWSENEKELKALLCHILTTITFEKERVGQWGKISEKSKEPGWFKEMVQEENHGLLTEKGIEGLVQLSGKSNAYLAKAFRKYRGITPSCFINALRVDKARMMLANTDKTIEEVSAASGYENLSHFYHRFKEQLGDTPNAYRKKYRGKLDDKRVKR